MIDPRIGTAGWAIPAAERRNFGATGSVLARYAGVFRAVEINSSFSRAHAPPTYARWAAAVPDEFRFAVKIPQTITHERFLADCDALLVDFAASVSGLGGKLGPLLVQLPPKLGFDPAVAARFFDTLGEKIAAEIVCEPRHPSWLEPQADALLAGRRIARVAADPAIVARAAVPGGWRGLHYWRLHGSPLRYRSSYRDGRLEAWAAAMCDGVPSWCIFDNTASGAAAGDALELRAMVQRDR